MPASSLFQENELISKNSEIGMRPRNACRDNLRPISTELLVTLIEDETRSNGEEGWIVASLSQASLFQGSGSLEHCLKRRSSVRNRKGELFLQILDSHVIQKNV